MAKWSMDELPVSLARARARFEKWRATRERRRIPDRLWEEAANLAVRFGVQRTAMALRLNGTSLKGRLPSDPMVVSEEPRFVELSPPVGDQGSADLTDAEGGRIRIEWRGTPPDLAALSQSFFGRTS